MSVKKNYEVRCRLCVTYYAWVPVRAKNQQDAMFLADEALRTGVVQPEVDVDDSEGRNLYFQPMWAQETAQ